MESPEIEELKPKILAAAEKDVYVLGICAGHQVLAQYSGRRVAYIPPEVGWEKAKITEKGKHHPLFRGLPEEISPFQVHKKAVAGRFEEDQILAENERIQAVEYWPGVYGFQGHPEESIEEGRRFLEENPKYRTINEEVLPLSAFSIPEVYVEWKILLNFVDMVKKRDPLKAALLAID